MGVWVMSLPRTLTVPALGEMKPVMVRRVVVLPQPEGPRKVDVLQGFEGAKSHFDMFKFDHALYLDDEQLRKKVGSLYGICKPTFPHYCKRTNFRMPG